MKLLITITVLLFAFALSAQTYPGDCVYYNRHADRISVNAIVLPTGLDTNFFKTNVFFAGDSACKTAYSILEVKPYDEKDKQFPFRLSQKQLQVAYYFFVRACSSRIYEPGYKPDFGERFGNFGCGGYLLTVPKEFNGTRKPAALKFMYGEI